MNDNQARDMRTRQSRSRVIGVGLASIALLPAFLLAAIVSAAPLERDGRSVPWSHWASMNAPFGIFNVVMSVLAVGAVIAMSRLLATEQRRQRAAPVAQKECTDPTHAERFQSTEASLRTLHLELLKMSINDPDLSEVWPPFEPGLSWERNRQYQYANLILQHMLLSLRLGRHGGQIENNLRYLFTSQLMRDFWLASRRARMTLAPGTQEFEFSRLIDDICAEYEDVLNSAGAER